MPTTVTCARADCGTGAAATSSSVGLGAHANVYGIAAGLHALVEVTDEETVLARSEREGLAVGRLGEHWHAAGEDGDGPAGRPQGLVVGYGTPRERVYPEALEALGRVLEGA